MIPSDQLVLLDTGVLVLLARGSDAGREIDGALGLRERSERPVISYVTIAEAWSFAAKRGWGPAKSKRLHDLFAHLVVAKIHQGGILDSYVTLDGFTEAQGRRMEKNDLWIAATAHALDAVLVTTDGDFDTVGKSHVISHRSSALSDVGRRSVTPSSHSERHDPLVSELVGRTND